MSCDKSAQPVSAAGAATAEDQSQPHLRRVLGLRDLVFYGIVLVQPVGVIGPFGLADRMSRGHVTLTIILGLVAMMFTAASYGRMGALYPTAGSAYTYVGRGLNPHLGFLAGWVMILDYLIIPIMSVVYAALSVQRLVDDFAPGFSHQLAAALGAQGKRVRHENDQDVWVKPLQNGAIAVLMLNRGTAEQTITLNWADLGVPPEKSLAVRDLWEHKDLGQMSGKFTPAPIPSHGTVMITLKP